MAIVNQDENKDKELNNTAPPQTGTQQGAIGAPQAPGSQPPQSSAPKQGSSSGRFNNISSYIKANQNFNKEGGGLAGKVAGNIQGKAQQTQQQIGQAGQQFGQEAQQGRTQYNQQLVQGALSDPTQFTQDPSRMAQFQQQREAVYKGPQQLQNVGQLQAGVGNVQQQAQAAGNEQGRFGLLKQMFNKPTYSAGQQKLDNLLLQGNQQQLKQLQGTQSLASQTDRALKQEQARAQGLASTFGEEARATAKATQDALTGEQSRQDEALNERVRKAQEAYESAKTGLQSGLGAGQLNQAQLSQLGLNEGQDLYNLDLNQYLQTDARQANRTNVAGAEDYARMNALAKLAGKDSSTEFYDPSQAGAFEKDQFGFDKDRFMSDLSGRQSSYQREIAPQQTMVNQAQTKINELQQYQDAFMNEHGGVDSGIQAQIDAEKAKLTTAQSALQNLANQYGIGRKLQLTPAQAAAAGVSEEEYSSR